MNAAVVKSVKDSRRNWKILASVLILGMALLYLPSAFYVLYVSGVDITSEKDTIGIEIHLNDRWFPLASSGTLIATVFGLARMDRGTVAYVRNSWLPQWPTNFTFVSKKENGYSRNSELTKGTSIRIGDVQGYAVRVTGSERLIVVVPKYSLMITTNSKQFLDSILGFNY